MKLGYLLLAASLVSCTIEYKNLDDNYKPSEQQQVANQSGYSFNSSFSECSADYFTKIVVNNQEAWVRNIALCNPKEFRDQGYPLPFIYDGQFNPVDPTTDFGVAIENDIKIKIDSFKKNDAVFVYGN